MFVYLDESGDLGFDFTKGGTSRFFVVTLLAVDNHEDHRRLLGTVERTIKNKMHRRKKGKAETLELKGSKTNLDVKKYFLRQLKETKIQIYSLILNKARVYQDLHDDKRRLYNFVARLLIEKCPFSQAREKIILTLDKSKDQKGIREFNQYLLLQLQGLIPVNIPVEIYHATSQENRGIQAADIFSWGIFRKYERKDSAWYELFQGKIRFEDVYLP